MRAISRAALCLLLLCAVFFTAAASDELLEKDRAEGRKVVELIEKNYELVADPAVLARLSMIADALAPHMPRDMTYEVRVIRMKAPNAFCLPGGFIFFTTGILDRLRSDAEVAAVMAHEMIHAARRHSALMSAKASKNSLVMLAGLAASVATGGVAAPLVAGQLGWIAMNSAYTVELEEEADSMGLDALIAAGYPPSAMVTVMEGFLDEETKQPMVDYGIYADHPESQQRVAAMSAKLKRMRIKLERKYPLNLLRTAIDEGGGRVRLTIDGAEVWGGRATPEARTAIARARDTLDRDFQMELAPYDLRLDGDVLYLRNEVLAAPPFQDDMSDMPMFRKRLLAALSHARSLRPVTRYFHGS
ncbi:MAG: M48 family metalloprotease [Synergistaceae bacterium]|jgi:Zn-dependent protease with chaperone function|nr:M48 family metalloprotease [Synergistaceae bacterium]